MPVQVRSCWWCANRAAQSQYRRCAGKGDGKGKSSSKWPGIVIVKDAYGSIPPASPVWRGRGSEVGTLLDREELVLAMAQGSKLVKWLDVLGGPVAIGQAVFVTGHLGRSGDERHDGD